MKLKMLIILFVLIGIFGTACEDLRKISLQQDKKKTPEAKKEDVVDSPQLAQLILKPKRPKLDISRDPFEPLFWEAKENPTKGAPLSNVDMLEDVKFLGLVRIGDTVSALLKTKSGKKMYHLDDQIREYKITDITGIGVVLTNGQRTIKVKRGVEK